MVVPAIIDHDGHAPSQERVGSYLIRYLLACRCFIAQGPA